MSFDIGETVGAYRVMEKLGQGGMASVFKAYHPALDRYVALKVMHRAFNADENFMARFQREARVVARLDHPNIVPIYDFAEHNGNSYLVMKYIEGETLKARLKRKSISPEEGLAVIKSVGAGLAYAHEKGILHRDVKPSNVILATDGQIYLTDFGLARIASMGESTLSSETMLGTPQYISPEQAMGKRDLDAGTDIYSFGVLIYELVVGDVPFRADTPIAIVHDHIYTPLPLPREKNPNVPEEVERILLKALAKERDDRYQTVNDLVAIFMDAVRPDSPAEMSGASARYTDETMASEGLFSGSTPVTGLATLNIEPDLEKPKRGWLKWAGIGAVLMVMCLCVLAILSNLDQIDDPITEPDDVPEEIVEFEGEKPFEEEKPLEEERPLNEEKPDPDAEQERMNELIRMIEENPEDPKAHLDLSGMYMRAGMYEDAQREMDMVMELVAEDEDFFRRNAQRMIDNGNYLLAYRLYLHYAESHPQEELPFWLKEGVQLTAYLGSGMEQAPEIIFSTFNWEERPDFILRGFFEILELRHQIYNGSINDWGNIETHLLDIIDQNPNWVIARLLYGEWLIIQQDYTLAEETLNSIFPEPNVPEWVKGLATYYLENEIP